MIRLILFFIVAAALAWVAVWLANSEGTVLVNWRGTDYPFPIGIVAAALIVFAIAAIILFEILRLLMSIPARVRQRRSRGRESQGFRELASGLMAAAAGDAAGARLHSKNAERMLEQSPATLLLTAQTAQLEGKEDVARLKFQQMLKHPETEFLGLRGLLAEAMKSGDYDEALSLARRAYKRSPNTPWVLTTLFELLTQAGEWEEALRIVGDLKRQKLISTAEATRRRALLNHMLARDEERAERYGDALSHAGKATQLAPRFAPAAATAARIAQKQGQERKARSFIESSWRYATHPELAQAYADLVPEEQPSSRLERFERLYNLQPNDAITHAAMAEIAIQARDWNKAKEHLERAREIDDTAGIYRLYAEYERASGGGEQAAERWLDRASGARPDKAWVCQDTGETLDEWRLFGPSGRFDCVHWDTPPTVTTMIADDRSGYVLQHHAGDGSTQSGANVATHGYRAPAGDGAASEAEEGGTLGSGPTAGEVRSPDADQQELRERAH